ncbi:hypothetical protein TrVGV298_006108 [Trichoderma virens]|nr:hypothetical protein TrVGV298_006108 [Trichoderma virens]
MVAQPFTGPQGQRYSRRPGLRNSMVPLHQRLLSKRIDAQEDSPLFSLLPAEIRAKIFTFALSHYEDTQALYNTNTFYSRPSYFAPRKTSTDLLRTCRAIYRETWPLPVALWEETVWMGHRLRAPPEYCHWKRAGKLQRLLPSLARQLGQEKAEIGSLHAFVQMFRLEHDDLASLLRTPGLHPRQLTLTIRDTDWRYWRQNWPLRFTAKWIKEVSSALSPSKTEFRIELEACESRKDEVDAIGKHIAENWFFGQYGGTILYADVSGKCHKVSRWTGPSIEGPSCYLNYYILTITFETELALLRKGGVASETARRNAGNPFYEHVPANTGDAEDEDEANYEAFDEDCHYFWSSEAFDCVLEAMPLPDDMDDDL